LRWLDDARDRDQPPDRIVGRRLFTASVTRNVFEDPGGRQYIVHEVTGADRP
jgi:hypothetical protein